MVETVKSSENRTEIVPLLERKKIKFPVNERKPLDFDENGKPVNPYKKLPEAASKLYYFGDNETEEFVELQITQGKPLRVVNVERADTEGGIKSIVGGFVDRDKNEIPGSGVTARREGAEEIGQTIGTDLISLGTWYTEGDRRNGRNKWIMANAFLYVETDENLDLAPSDEAKKVETVVLDKKLFSRRVFCGA